MVFLYLKGNFNKSGRSNEKFMRERKRKKICSPRLQILFLVEEMCLNTDVILVALCFISKSIRVLSS
jgi:hypothetical protein